MSSLVSGAITKKAMDAVFLSSPGDDLINKMFYQMTKIDGFKQLFGEFKNTAGFKNTDKQRWADYQRMDWSTRELPAINSFNVQNESKEAENGFLSGTIQIQVFWPANFRRSDLTQIPISFKGSLISFFSSKLCSDMLDELYHVKRIEKVFGLNEFGKSLVWSPLVEGLVADELVPVTILEVPYKIDLRAWKRALEYMGRTNENPFAVTLKDLTGFDSVYQGIHNDKADPIDVDIKQEIKLTNPY